jgi:flagellar hook-associated protein 3 FlgL
MRVATTQVYRQAVTGMQQQQSRLHQVEQQLSSGLRIMKPSDDPTGSVQILNLSSNLDVVNQYDRNIAVATAAISHQESVLQTINDSLQRVRELTVQANNPTNHDSARQSIAREIELRLQEITQLANSRDTNGEYLFSGALVDTPPFIESGSAVSYQGDQTSRQIQVGESAKVQVRDSGDALFMNIKGGDGQIQVLPAADNTGSLVIGQFGAGAAYIPDTYTVDFYEDAQQQLRYTVTDSSATVVSDAEYKAGSSIAFNGLQFAVTGKPALGDRVTVRPAQSVDMFAMVRNIADMLNVAVKSPADSAKVQNAMGQGLANLDQALETVNNQRAKLGARLNTIDSTDSVNQDFKLQLETVLSQTRDLDYAEAISRFNQQLTSLQVAQQAFAKTSELSLFRFL